MNPHQATIPKINLQVRHDLETSQESLHSPRFFTHASLIQRVSSMYCQWEITTPLLPTLKPVNKFVFKAFLIKPLNLLPLKGTKMDILHWQEWTSKLFLSSVGLPLTRMDILPQKTQALIQAIHLPQKPTFNIMYSRKPRSTEFQVL
jgi:hypothetical protein